VIVFLSADGQLDVEDPMNFRAFSFRADRGRQLQDVEAVTFSGEYAWISERHLRNWRPRAGSQEWQDGLSRMIDYARGRGWIDPDSGAIRAHIERG
jgi:hypothetical protein